MAGPRGSQFQFRPVDRLLSPPIQRLPLQLVAAAHGPTITCSAGVDSQPAAAAERPLSEVAVAELHAAAVEKAFPGSRRCGAIGDRPGFDQPAAGPGLAHPAPSPHQLMHAPTWRGKAAAVAAAMATWRLARLAPPMPANANAQPSPFSDSQERSGTSGNCKNRQGRMGRSRKGMPLSQLHKEALSRAHKDVPLSHLHKQAIGRGVSRAFKGVLKTQAQKEGISKGKMKGKKAVFNVSKRRAGNWNATALAGAQ